MVSQILKVDLTEQFRRLPHAPIVEAVIEMRARAEVPWEESTIRGRLTPLLPGYQKIEKNDIVVFNWPVDTVYKFFDTSKRKADKPIDKKSNYVKRCV